MVGCFQKAPLPSHVSIITYLIQGQVSKISGNHETATHRWAYQPDLRALADIPARMSLHPETIQGLSHGAALSKRGRWSSVPQTICTRFMLSSLSRSTAGAFTAMVCILLIFSTVHHEAWAESERESKREIAVEHLLPPLPFSCLTHKLATPASLREKPNSLSRSADLGLNNQVIFLPGYGTADLSPPALLP